MGKRTGKNIVCQQCGKEFYAAKWELERGGGGKGRTGKKFCSHKCYSSAQKGCHHSPETEIKPGQRLGVATEFKKGQVPANFKGYWQNKLGYKVIERAGQKRKFEHRIVAEQKIGRELSPNECVHHLDGDVTNNEPDNLEVITRTEHYFIHKPYLYSPRTKKGWNNV